MGALWLRCVLVLACLGWSGFSSAPVHGFAKRSQGGFRFPALKVRYTQYKKGWNLYIRAFQFTSVVGKQPFTMLYFQPGHAPSEKELKAFAQACQKHKKLTCLAVAPISRFHEIRKLYKWLKQHKVDLPVLLDSRRLISYVTMTRKLPSYAAVTRAGWLCMVNASSLKERVSRKLRVEGVMKKLAQGKELSMRFAPGIHPNPFDHVNQPMKPFSTKVLTASGSTLGTLNHKKLLVIGQPALFFFWSLSCDPCRRLFPLIERVVRKRAKNVTFVTFVQADTSALRKQLKRYMNKQKIQSTVALAPKGKHFDAYNALLMPTLLLFDASGQLQDAKMRLKGKIGETIKQMIDGLSTPNKPLQ